MIQAIDIRFFSFGGAEINLIRNVLRERMARNSNRMIELGVSYFNQEISYRDYLYNEEPLEQENNQIENMLNYLDSVQYGTEFNDHESVEYDED
jgi:hypothetical protein